MSEDEAVKAAPMDGDEEQIEVATDLSNRYVILSEYPIHRSHRNKYLNSDEGSKHQPKLV
jgi:hypothetical protein